MMNPSKSCSVFGLAVMLVSASALAQGTTNVDPPEGIAFRDLFFDRDGTVFRPQVAAPDSIEFRAPFIGREGAVLAPEVSPPSRLVFREPFIGRGEVPLLVAVEKPAGLVFRPLFLGRDGEVLDEHVEAPEGLVFRDVLIGRGGVPTSVDQAPPLRLIDNARAVPNPFNPSTQISFRLREAGRTSVAVYDTRGRRVRVLHDGPLAADAHVLRWDGRDDAGGALASGHYFVRIASGSEAVVVKGVLIE